MRCITEHQLLIKINVIRKFEKLLRLYLRDCTFEDFGILLSFDKQNGIDLE